MYVPRSRHARATAGRLGEAHRSVADLWLGLESRHGDRRDADLARAELHLRDAEVTTPEMAVVHDLAVLHLDESTELVRLTERVGLGHRLQVRMTSGGLS